MYSDFPDLMSSPWLDLELNVRLTYGLKLEDFGGGGQFLTGTARVVHLTDVERL